MTEIIKMLDDGEINAPQIELWKNNLDRYSDEHNLDFKKQAFYLSKVKDSSSEPDFNGTNTGIVLVRMALSDLEGKVSSAGKYVILQSFYDEGDLGTIDVVRLPKEYHREIVKEYLDNILTPEISRQIVPVNKDGLSRFLTAGGFVDSDGKNIIFNGQSGDFSNKFSIYNVNDVASYLARESGLFETAEPKDNGQGIEYITKCLDIMANHKLKPEFYHKLVDLYFLENVRAEKGTGSHLLYSLNSMKAIDRAINEGKDVTQMMVEEMTEGISRDMLVMGVAEKMKKAKK